MNIKKLKNIIKDLPDTALVLYKDPNFSGAYHLRPEEDNFTVNIEDDITTLLIDFPFEHPFEHPIY